MICEISENHSKSLHVESHQINLDHGLSSEIPTILMDTVDEFSKDCSNSQKAKTNEEMITPISTQIYQKNLDATSKTKLIEMIDHHNANDEQFSQISTMSLVDGNQYQMQENSTNLFNELLNNSNCQGTTTSSPSSDCRICSSSLSSSESMIEVIDQFDQEFFSNEQFLQINEATPSNISQPKEQELIEFLCQLPL